MTRAPGKALFYANTTQDEAGPAGVNINTEKTFTENDMEEYLPGATALPREIKKRIIKAHNELSPIFKPAEPHKALHWPFKYNISNKTPTHKIDITTGIA